jgi:hypothetical protein
MKQIVQKVRNDMEFSKQVCPGQEGKFQKLSSSYLAYKETLPKLEVKSRLRPKHANRRFQTKKTYEFAEQLDTK